MHECSVVVYDNKEGWMDAPSVKACLQQQFRHARKDTRLMAEYHRENKWASLEHGKRSVAI